MTILKPGIVVFKINIGQFWSEVYKDINYATIQPISYSFLFRFLKMHNDINNVDINSLVGSYVEA